MSSINLARVSTAKLLVACAMGMPPPIMFFPTPAIHNLPSTVMRQSQPCGQAQPTQTWSTPKPTAKAKHTTPDVEWTYAAPPAPLVSGASGNTHQNHQSGGSTPKSYEQPRNSGTASPPSHRANNNNNMVSGSGGQPSNNKNMYKAPAPTPAAAVQNSWQSAAPAPAPAPTSNSWKKPAPAPAPAPTVSEGSTNWGTPQKTQTVPVSAQPVPAKAQPVPVNAQPVPVNAQPVPVNAQPLPVNAQPVPVNAQPAPAPPPSPFPSPSPSSAPPALPGSFISLENTNASATGNKSLSVGAERDQAAAAGNGLEGDFILLGAQPGSAQGVVAPLAGMLGGGALGGATETPDI